MKRKDKGQPSPEKRDKRISDIMAAKIQRQTYKTVPVDLKRERRSKKHNDE